MPESRCVSFGELTRIVGESRWFVMCSFSALGNMAFVVPFELVLNLG